MATDDTILTPDSLTVREGGLAIALKIPWYRSLWLSSVSGVELTLDGVKVPQAALRAELNDQSWEIEQLADQWDQLWFVRDRLVIVASLDDAKTPGDSVDIEVTLTLRLPYMQIAPMTYVTNHATNRRVLVAG